MYDFFEHKRFWLRTRIFDFLNLFFWQWEASGIIKVSDEISDKNVVVISFLSKHLPQTNVKCLPNTDQAKTNVQTCLHLAVIFVVSLRYLVLIYFEPFSNKIYLIKAIYNRQTPVIQVEGKHTVHKTTTTTKGIVVRLKLYNGMWILDSQKSKHS